MPGVTSARPAHSATRTVGGSLADWLVGFGVLALVVAALGAWGPDLTGWRRAPAASSAPVAVSPPQLAETPLATLPPLEAPAPVPGSQPLGHHAARPEEGLAPEVVSLIESTSAQPEAIIEARQADGFVRADRLLRLPATGNRGVVAIDALTERLSADPAATVTVRQAVEATHPRRLVDLLHAAAGDVPTSRAQGSLEQMAQQLLRDTPDTDDPAALSRLSQELSSAGIDPQARFAIDLPEGRSELALVELLARGHLADAQATIPVVERNTSLASLTFAELQAVRASGTTELEVVDGPASGSRTVTLEELMAEAGGPAETIYYVRTVQPGDEQGVWGIVQRGVMVTFAQGVKIGDGSSGRTIRLDIPPDADELEGRRSSFLGRLIARKVDASWVYNLEDGRMGRNPHLVYPGQELVIVGFQPAELNDIYRYFSQAATASAPLSHR